MPCPLSPPENTLKRSRGPSATAGSSARSPLGELRRSRVRRLVGDEGAAAFVRPADELENRWPERGESRTRQSRAAWLWRRRSFVGERAIGLRARQGNEERSGRDEEDGVTVLDGGAAKCDGQVSLGDAGCPKRRTSSSCVRSGGRRGQGRGATRASHHRARSRYSPPGRSRWTARRPAADCASSPQDRCKLHRLPTGNCVTSRGITARWRC